MIFRMVSKLSGFFQMIVNFLDGFTTVQIFPDDCQFSGRFQNYPNFSRSLPIFWTVSKLPGFLKKKKIVRIAYLMCAFPISDISHLNICSLLFQRSMASASSGKHTPAMGLLYCITNPSGSKNPIVPATTSS